MYCGQGNYDRHHRAERYLRYKVPVVDRGERQDQYGARQQHQCHARKVRDAFLLYDQCGRDAAEKHWDLLNGAERAHNRAAPLPELSCHDTRSGQHDGMTDPAIDGPQYKRQGNVERDFAADRPAAGYNSKRRAAIPSTTENSHYRYIGVFCPIRRKQARVKSSKRCVCQASQPVSRPNTSNTPQSIAANAVALRRSDRQCERADHEKELNATSRAIADHAEPRRHLKRVHPVGILRHHQGAAPSVANMCQ